jgi:UDP-N-acetylmuramoyl-L-alanyl-D-glutamate--2,6-diaminopimelate ligase
MRPRYRGRRLRLTELIADDGAAAPAAPVLAGRPEGPVEITGLTADSREVRPGFLFAALPGVKTDGRRFVAEAVERGAVAILTEAGQDSGTPGFEQLRVSLVIDENPRRRLALMAARFFAPQPRIIAAVTGTSGKTSVASFTRQIWHLLEIPAASLGTLGIVAPDLVRYGSLTTPDPVNLHRDLAELASRGIDHVALEASSHGLDQFRLDGVRVTAAAFTNLSRDHFDYHPGMEAYLQAKLRLFDAVMAPGGHAVLNADSDVFPVLAETCRHRGHRTLRFGSDETAELRLLASRVTPAGQALDLDIFGRSCTTQIRLTGSFQAANVLAALGLVIACGGDPDRALATLPLLTGVPGRLEPVATLPNRATIYVDYAHKPDALEKVLTALRPHAAGRLTVVFGCGGDRDPGKRAVMGEVAQRLADLVIVTDDNPRSEKPEAIRAAILEGCPGASEIGDRRAAIRTGIACLAEGDLLVIAGKGHETGQIVGGTVHPFDDAAVARELAAELAGQRQ